jgi:hypothetical protein
VRRRDLRCGGRHGCGFDWQCGSGKGDGGKHCDC